MRLWKSGEVDVELRSPMTSQCPSTSESAILFSTARRARMRAGLVHAPELDEAPKISKAGIGLTLAAGMLVACADRPPEPMSATKSTSPDTTIPSTDEPLQRPSEIMGKACYSEEPSTTEETPLSLASGSDPNVLPRSEVMGRIGMGPHAVPHQEPE